MVKTNSGLVIDENNEAILLEAMDQLVEAHSKIQGVFLSASSDSRIEDMINGSLNHYYPYHKCFNELFDEVLAWRDAFRMCVEGKSVEEIDKELKGE